MVGTTHPNGRLAFVSGFLRVVSERAAPKALDTSTVEGPDSLKVEPWLKSPTESPIGFEFS